MVIAAVVNTMTLLVMTMMVVMSVPLSCLGMVVVPGVGDDEWWWW